MPRRSSIFRNKSNKEVDDHRVVLIPYSFPNLNATNVTPSTLYLGKIVFPCKGTIHGMVLHTEGMSHSRAFLQVKISGEDQTEQVANLPFMNGVSDLGKSTMNFEVDEYDLIRFTIVPAPLAEEGQEEIFIRDISISVRFLAHSNRQGTARIEVFK